MNVKYCFYIAMVVSGGLSIILSIRYHWINPMWSKLNRKIKTCWNVPIWILIVVLTNIVTQLVLEVFSISTVISNVFLGIVMGVMFFLMPDISYNVKNKDRKEK